MAGSQGSGSDPGTGQASPGTGVQEPGSQQPGQDPQSGQTIQPVIPPVTGAPATPPQGDQGGDQTPPQEPPRQQTDWRDRRIGELTARTRELRAENERLRAQAGQQPPNGNGDGARDTNGQFRQPAGYQGPPDQSVIDAQIEQRASILAAQQEFNRRCNEVAEAGRRTYTDFDAQVGRLIGLVDPQDEQRVAQYNEFLNAAMETGEAGKLLHALGGNLDEASRILSLHPRRMAVELTRMAAKPISELSRAPRPINPAATNAQVMRTSMSPDDPGSDQMSTEEWMRRRNEQIAARGVRR